MTAMAEETMRAMAAPALGAPLEARAVPRPTPGPGEALIRVAACGVNFADTLMVAGRYQERAEPPIIPGLEVVGRIEAVGPPLAGAEPASDLSVGDRVMAALSGGGMAEFAAAPLAGCVAAPETVSAPAAAAALVGYGTAHLALAERARLAPGERLLVTGAAGGAGLAAVEMGALLGAEVVAAARGAARLETAVRKGAARLIDTAEADLLAELKALGGIDVAYDTVGGDAWKAAMRAARFEARLLPIGFASGEVPAPPANILLVKNLDVIGVYWGAYVRAKPETLGRSLAALRGWLASGALTPEVGHVLPLAEAEAALDLLRERAATGKVVLEIAPEA